MLGRVFVVAMVAGCGGHAAPAPAPPHSAASPTPADRDAELEDGVRAIATRELGASTASHETDTDATHRAIRRSIRQLIVCYDRKLANAPLANEVTIRLTIGNDGTVTTVGASGFGREVDACLERARMGLYFPVPPNVVEIRWPYDFASTP
jgi:hypothetical protein